MTYVRIIKNAIMFMSTAISWYNHIPSSHINHLAILLGLLEYIIQVSDYQTARVFLLRIFFLLQPKMNTQTLNLASMSFICKLTLRCTVSIISILTLVYAFQPNFSSMEFPMVRLRRLHEETAICYKRPQNLYIMV